MFDRLLSLPVAYFDANATGNVIARVTYDVTQVTNAATKVLTVLVRDSVAVAGLLLYMLWLSTWSLHPHCLGAAAGDAGLRPLHFEADAGGQPKPAAHHGRDDPCPGGGRARQPHRQGVWRPGVRAPALRQAGQLGAPLRLQEPGGGRHRRARGGVHRRGDDRYPHLRRHRASGGGAHVGGRVRLLLCRHGAALRPHQAAHRHQPAPAERAGWRRERLRPHRRGA